MEKSKEHTNWGLEIAKVIYALVMSLVLFLFFTLLLDAFCVLAFGEWNPLLGSWPIFTGTVNSALYSPPLHVISLVVGLTVMSRIILGDRTPFILSFLDANSEELPADDI